MEESDSISLQPKSRTELNPEIKDPIVVKLENGSSFNINIKELCKYSEELLREEIKLSNRELAEENDEADSEDYISFTELRVLDLKLYILKLISIRPGTRKVEQISLFTESRNDNKESSKAISNDKIFDVKSKYETDHVSDCENLASIIYQNGLTFSMMLNNCKVSLSINQKLGSSSSNIQIETVSSCSVYYLKLLILQKLSRKDPNEET